MKVLLRKDISHIGRKNDVKEVSDGYALNFLFPQGLAERATSERIKVLEEERKRGVSKRDEAEQAMGAALTKHTEPITLLVSANEKGHLFAAIHERDVAQAISREWGVDVPAERLTLQDPIREIGSYTATVRLGASEHPIKIIITAAEK